MRIAELLSRYELTGTFYISRAFAHEGLSSGEIRELSLRHEIGGHTTTHPNLTKISEAEARREIAENKQFLEETVGKKISMFCYPYGFYNDAVKKIVRESGFVGARTTRAFSRTPLADPYELHTTVHAYPFPLRKKDSSSILLVD